jgi:hypothetical protein
MVAFAAALAVWAIATPAFAAAPLCDPRGATGIAPAPQLQEPETSIDVGDGDATDDCGVFVVSAESVDDGRAPAPTPPAAVQDQVVPSHAPAISPATSTGSFARDGTSGSERAGARSRVDRPPRT